MRIALVAPPFIPVPPKNYGGTELFVANLACGLQRRGFEVVVYTNGASTIDTEKRWLYPTPEWPIKGEIYANMRELNHTSWAVSDAAGDCDIIHLNSVAGLSFSRFVGSSFVYTIHHPHIEELSEFYGYYPDVHFVTISDFQLRQERLPLLRTIHHGIDISLYDFQPRKQDYLVFLGRIAPIKGTHLAIQVAKATGLPLKIAGEVQPMFREYFETCIKPEIDGKFIEFVGEADLQAKNELLGNARALLFPIQWDEPFGLVMVEAMACGTPVLALPGGAVEEVVAPGVSGFICSSVADMAEKVVSLPGSIRPAAVRKYAEDSFSLGAMVDQYVTLYREIMQVSDGVKPQELLSQQRAVA
jgi:glycosyltransferase involved in cell wall biosynthesis